MSRVAQAYICGVLLAGITLAGLAFAQPVPEHVDWTLLAFLLGLATLAQLRKVEAPNHVLFYTSPVFFFAGALLLPPALLVPLIIVPHVVEWAHARLRHSKYLRAWYLQPFNMAMYLVATRAASTAATVVTRDTGYGLGSGTIWSLIAVLVAALCYLIINAALLGTALVLARRISWRDSGVLDPQSVLLDAMLVCVGSAAAALCHTDPWIVPLTLAPLVLMYRALMIPQLKRDTQIDAKTGLASARHLADLFAAELNRAARFGRPLAVLMADLDHFKAVNDTYGHLAGDAVLLAIGQLIRATVRDYNVAGRFGGEEFMVVLPEVSDIEVRAYAERLRQAVEDAAVAAVDGAAPLRVTVSIGVACFPAHGTTTAGLTAAADAALYRAKTTGRNRVAFARDVVSLQENEPPSSLQAAV